jgi:3-phenylpropionate/cinnamic acid dioxygenase small subunit
MMLTDVARDDLQRAVGDLYSDYATALDRRRMSDWIDFFAEDGLYSLTTNANAAGKGLYLIYEKGRDAITRRAAVSSGYLQVQRNKTLHIISNVRVTSVDGSRLSVNAYFAMFRTARDKTSQLHACGEFHDLVINVGDRLRLLEHNVVVDAETLPANMVELF